MLLTQHHLILTAPIFFTHSSAIILFIPSFAILDGFPDRPDVSLAPLLQHQLQLPNFNTQIQLHYISQYIVDDPSDVGGVDITVIYTAQNGGDVAADPVAVGLHQEVAFALERGGEGAELHEHHIAGNFALNHELEGVASAAGSRQQLHLVLHFSRPETAKNPHHFQPGRVPHPHQCLVPRILPRQLLDCFFELVEEQFVLGVEVVAELPVQHLGEVVEGHVVDVVVGEHTCPEGELGGLD